MGLFDFFSTKQQDAPRSVTLQGIFKKGFVYQVDRYEEWQAGNCIGRGSLSAKIIATNKGNEIHCRVEGADRLRMKKESSFEYISAYILSDRVQYVHAQFPYDPIVPMLLHVFVANGTVSCVRFAMTSPDRIIEFYGKLIKIA